MATSKRFFGMFGGVLGLLILILAGCSSQVVYRPEVSGQGVIYDRGSLVYSIPASSPLVKMRLSYRGIEKGLLRIHTRFIRKVPFDPTTTVSMDPKEQTLDIGDARGLAPKKVFSSLKGRPIIVLSPDTRQAVDLLYQVPLENGELPKFPFFKIHWKVNFGQGLSEEHTVRFDLQHRSGGESAADADFGPYGEFEDAGWYPGGWAWW